MDRVSSLCKTNYMYILTSYGFTTLCILPSIIRHHKTSINKVTHHHSSTHKFPSRKLECFPFCQRFRKFRSEFKWKGPLRFFMTGIFEITSRGGPLISVGIFAVPFLTNLYFALTWEIEKKDYKMVRVVSFEWPGLTGKCRSILSGIPSDL